METRNGFASPDLGAVNGSRGLLTPSSSSTQLSGLRSTHDTVTTNVLRKGHHDHNIDIYPCEASVCQQLISSIESTDHLQPVLRKAVDTLQRHSKWFPQEGLEHLLQHALAKSSQSTSTADLYVALDLVDVACTFTALPRSCLLPVVKFICFSYYQGTRMHKHKSLAEKAWSLFQHILNSHLGSLGTTALLEVLVTEETLYSRASYAATSGALRLLEEKFTFTESTAVSSLHISPFNLLPSLQNIVREGDVMLKEQVIAILRLILSSDTAMLDLEATASWNALVDLVENCAILPGNTAGHDLLDHISDVSYLLEPPQLERLFHVFTAAGHRLPREVTEQVMQPLKLTTRIVLEDEHTYHDQLLETFTQQEICSDELHKVIQDDCELLACTRDRSQWTRLIQLYLDMLLGDTLTGEVATACASFFTASFYLALSHSFEKSRLWETIIVFDALTKIVTSATEPEARLCAFRVLARLRVAINGYIYLEEDETSSGAFATSTTPGLIMLSDLPRKLWLDEIALLIQKPEAAQYQMTAAFVLKSLPDQMHNLLFFVDQKPHVRAVYDIAVHKLATANHSHAADYIQILTALINYRGLFSASEERHMVELFIKKAGSSEAVSKDCIHALTVCCHELPVTVARDLDQVIQKMAQMITQKHLAIHVLEFLTGLSRLPNLFRNFRSDDFRKVFGVCISYLQSLRAGSMSRQSATTTSDAASSSQHGAHEIMPQYVYALAHHVIVFWYITLRPDDRQIIKAYVTNSLCYLREGNRDMPDDQGMVVIDFMERIDVESTVQYGSRALGDGDTDDIFDDVDGKILEQHRICGMMLISTHTSLRTAKTLVETRRPSGTARYLVFGKSPISRESWTSTFLSPVPPSIWSGSAGDDDTMTIYSDDADGSAYGTVSVPHASSPLGSSDIVTLPEDPSLDRAIVTFDRTPGLDSHKAGIIYIGEDQTDEIDILANSSGSPDYRDIVSKLGNLRELRGAKFNTQGLSTTDGTDGEHAIVWNNDVTELVFHITTMMPSDPDDIKSSAYSKKRHVGNDFVNIVFNNSGQPFRFDTLPSAFNYVYIVISPSVRTSFLQTRTHTMNTSDQNRFYKVEVVTRDDFPAISSAAEAKMISGASLPGYIRNLALNACVFSDVWVNRESDEYKSSWRTRLDQIRRLKDRHAPTRTAPRKMSSTSKGKGKLQFWK